MAAPEMKQPHEWYRLGDIVVSFTMGGQIEDALWDQYVAALRADGVRMLFGIASEDASGISATQRKAASDAMQQKSIQAVAVTNSRVLRGVLTAVSWLGAKVKAYSWDSFDQALQAAGADASQQAELRAMMAVFTQRFK